MKILYKLTKWTLVASLIRAVYWTIQYINDWRYAEQSLHGDGFRSILKRFLRMDARIDWLGRVYGVVNPSINEKGEFDFNGMVFELDGVNTNNQSWVENWLYKQMILVNNVFDVDKTGFFDIIDVSITHVGPDNADNYLIVFDIASRKEMARRWRRVATQSIIYTIICAFLLLVF